MRRVASLPSPYPKASCRAETTTRRLVAAAKLTHVILRPVRLAPSPQLDQVIRAAQDLGSEYDALLIKNVSPAAFCLLKNFLCHSSEAPVYRCRLSGAMDDETLLMQLEALRRQLGLLQHLDSLTLQIFWDAPAAELAAAETAWPTGARAAAAAAGGRLGERDAALQPMPPAGEDEPAASGAGGRKSAWEHQLGALAKGLRAMAPQ
ncbi:MAG: hypothetical protein EOO40_11095, partial [Deltaproteobacteria bacterium]